MRMTLTIGIVWLCAAGCSPALPAPGPAHPASPTAPATAPAPRPATLRPSASIDEVVPATSEPEAPPAHHHHGHGGHS